MGRKLHVEPGIGQCRQILRRRAGRGDIAGQFLPAVGMRDLQMTDGDVRRAQTRCNSRQPVAGVRFVENQVAGQGQIDRIIHRRDRMRNQKRIRAPIANSRPRGDEAVAS